MNRRSLLQLTVGLVAALIGIRPKPILSRRRAKLRHRGRLLNCKCGSWTVSTWTSPVDRYKDMVDVDWAAAQEWDNLYVAECRVRPGPAQPWEKFRMKRDG